MQVGHGDVVAPDDDEVRVTHLLRRHAGCGSVETRVGGTSHDSAQLPAREQRGSQAVKEATVHGASGELTVRPGVVQRQHRLRTVARDRAGNAGMDEVQGFAPGDGRERTLSAPARALERANKPCGSVHELRIGACDLVADHAGRVRVGLRAPYVEDADPIRTHRKAAGVRAVQRADAGACLSGIGSDHDPISSNDSARPRAFVHKRPDARLRRRGHAPHRPASTARMALRYGPEPGEGASGTAAPARSLHPEHREPRGVAVLQRIQGPGKVAQRKDPILIFS